LYQRPRAPASNTHTHTHTHTKQQFMIDSKKAIDENSLSITYKKTAFY